MNLKKAQYVTVNDSRLIANGSLNVGGELVPLSNFDFGIYGDVQRKVLVSWCGGAKVNYGSAVSSSFISRREVVVDVVGGGGVSLDIGVEKLILDSSPVSVGKYRLCIEVNLDVPLKTIGEVPEHVKPLVQYSEVLNVVFSLDFCASPLLNEVSRKRPVYDGYGQLGFFIADLQKMNDYVVSRLGPGKINLKNAFCETEIANELFEEGLLILVWGMTPWQYYIYGLDEVADAKYVPGLIRPQFEGKYRLRSDITEPSVVPGEFLLNWPECMLVDFPKISLGGSGETVSVEVSVMGFYIPGIGVGPRLAVITASRQESEMVIDPLLRVDIESVEPELGF
ncbi:hypothetical protein [Pseudomonas sp. H9]|uniref:hypothetical protein n=1 Tax=Pseudomonas sp. H9 TaxID=483968 RepID=UPI001057EFDA|nr:hypothetical protein [Pseudomonas sp. H9]TDF81472.1 hypothetical protein E1573_16935 [Pseudomonas sp. H9]